jgi:hypothetical protein
MARLDWAAIPALRHVSFHRCDDFSNDYIGQQITKLHADTYSDADVILHVDSDNVFVAPCHLPDRLFEHGKLRIACDPSGRRPPSDGWRRCASIFLRQDVSVDVTGAPPVAFRRHLYRALRQRCEEAHGISIRQYALTTRVDQFSEFALLRAYALLYEPREYAWVDVSTRAYLPECRSFWSRAQTSAAVMHELPEVLRSRLASWSAAES